MPNLEFKKYLSGIEVVQNQNGKIAFYQFLINREKETGTGFRGLFRVTFIVMNNNEIKYIKENLDGKKLISTKHHNHPIENRPFFGHIYDKNDVSNILLITSDNPNAVLTIPCLNVIGVDHLDQTFNDSRILRIKQNDLSAIIHYGIQQRGPSQQNRISL